MNPGFNALDHAPQRVGQEVRVGNEGAAEQDAVGAGALERDEVRVLPQLDAIVAAAEHAHNLVFGVVRVGEDGAE